MRMPRQYMALPSPDQTKQEHVPGVPSGHKGWEGVLHVDQDVHVADMIGHDHGCRSTGRTQLPDAAQTLQIASGNSLALCHLMA